MCGVRRWWCEICQVKICRTMCVAIFFRFVISSEKKTNLASDDENASKENETKKENAYTQSAHIHHQFKQPKRNRKLVHWRTARIGGRLTDAPQSQRTENRFYFILFLWNCAQNKWVRSKQNEMEKRIRTHILVCMIGRTVLKSAPNCLRRVRWAVDSFTRECLWSDARVGMCLCPSRWWWRRRRRNSFFPRKIN